MYAKKINEHLRFIKENTGHIETEDGILIINPSAEKLIENGYKICIYTNQPEPEENYYYKSSWEEESEDFLQIWIKTPVPIPQIVAELKAKLAATDYKALKYAEGWISEDDYAPIKAYRQELRDEINKYENL